jgi:hypothetical protein
MLAERLDKAWGARRESTAIDPVMRFSDEGLVLGAGTVLAPSGGSSCDIRVDPLAPRLAALLSAAHLHRPTVGALAHLRKAAERWSEGQDALAAMHLALSRVDRLEQPEADAHRLFLADGLLKDGIKADAIIGAIEAGGPAFERLYNPNQPRVPAGSGRPSGQWTSGGTSSATSSRPQSKVNPGTLTPAVIISHRDACLIARIECVENTLNDLPKSGAANDNGEDKDWAQWKANEYVRCHLAYAVCEDLSAIVHYTPFIQRAAVIFPDRGVVLSEKGFSEDRYIPPGYRVPPMRRR